MNMRYKTFLKSELSNIISPQASHVENVWYVPVVCFNVLKRQIQAKRYVTKLRF